MIMVECEEREELRARAESRQQIKFREQRAESREQKKSAESIEQRIESRDQEAESRVRLLSM
jgi:hypothetical protein